ncbi:MAG: hypothetical protein RLZZ326_2413 [Planctomycetota bacterium]|jgi:hypothetical protein
MATGTGEQQGHGAPGGAGTLRSRSSLPPLPHRPAVGRCTDPDAPFQQTACRNAALPCAPDRRRHGAGISPFFSAIRPPLRHGVGILPPGTPNEGGISPPWQSASDVAICRALPQAWSWTRPPTSLPCSRLRFGGTEAADLARPAEERCPEPPVSVGRGHQIPWKPLVAFHDHRPNHEERDGFTVRRATRGLPAPVRRR